VGAVLQAHGDRGAVARSGRGGRLVLCSPAQGGSSMATDPGDLDRLFAEYLNAGDLEGLMTLYEPGCRLVRRDRSVAAGHDEIRVMLGRLVGMRPAFRTEAGQGVGERTGS